MSSVTKKSLSVPDETRAPEKTLLEMVSLGQGVAVARMTLQPGWRWSECVRPVAGTEVCQARHVGAVLGGRLHVRHEDGTEVDLDPGDAYVIEAGHDAWVSGDEPFIAVEFDAGTASKYATPGS